MSRSVTLITKTPFQQYDLEGPVQPEISWLPISYRKEGGVGSYLMHMLPGAETIARDHPGHEEFVVLEGELIDSDGTVFKAGDFVSFAPRHTPILAHRDQLRAGGVRVAGQGPVPSLAERAITYEAAH